MTRFSDFTDEELDVMEDAFCNEGLKYLVGEIRKERESRLQRCTGFKQHEETYDDEKIEMLLQFGMALANRV